MTHQLENAAVTLEKAKQSKIKRYNKYVGLQNEYKGMVSQVQRLMEENNDLKMRHKTFVRTVEQTLVGGERDGGALASTFTAAREAHSAGAGAGAGAGAEMNLIAWEGPTGTPSSILTDSTAASYLHGRGLGQTGTAEGGATDTLPRAPGTGASTASSVSVVTPSSAEMAIDSMNRMLHLNKGHGDEMAAFPDLTFEGEGEAGK